MKKMLTPIAFAIALAGCQTTTENNNTDISVAAEKAMQNNPFFHEYDTPFGIAPFEKIKNAHYLPAFDKGIKENKAEILAIANSPIKPTFENTIEAMEKSGVLLNKVSNVFYGLTGSMSSDEIREISKILSPKLSALTDDILLNEKLFKRVKAVYDHKEALTLRVDQKTLLEITYKNFVRGGANLTEKSKNELRELNQKISKLSLKFGENLLAETNNFELVIDKKSDLAGLPDDIIAAAAQTAKERGHDGKWVFTTHRPSKNPFLTYAKNRDLRKAVYNGYTHRGDNNNEFDNKKFASEIASLRFQRAQVLGYKTHADYVLENATAKTPQNVFKLLDQVWPAALAKAKVEAADMQKMIDAEGGNFKLAAWDWWYYAEKIRKDRYDLDAAEAKPYFSLEGTLQGIFYTAEKLWGVTFVERFDIPKYHEDVRTFEVFDKDGSSVGLYLTDHYVRESKRGGAWMSSFRKQYRMFGEDVQPIIYNVLNYPRPVGDTPTLLTFDQASTLFHEFGHAIQGLLSDGYYRSQTGTALPRDYVEYPSQVMENWMMEPEVLAKFAKHYKTGEVIPMSLINKIQAAGQFNQGFATTEYLAAALLDMNWHSLETDKLQDADKFEKSYLDKIGLIKEIAPRYRSTYFSHIFSGGYSSGYYGYIWSNIYDADTWEVFKEKGIFDQATAQGYRKHVLEPGGTEDPALMYKRFRGQDPKIEPLLKRRGLLNK
ncbi:M3 family metallopeptidase [Pseudoalteromonas denitrificans]|uniref:Peptidyl-dipeptidase Dcp. Metallo peptidase. MEROPS family M03A n=1 Tax=Pseudoalteromonas denitrificans DSM 6059 TaxID=1123010 RepID=A0A1I1FGK9_9GAMM|nr:M3 family metallopeptidase [Pseudoalteromonas denitrificans]SFB96190.1 peptidyl-dipeptidase Dcp . Metallo peptidase. MEROPS family M03A [Pseudoalteromonas denitrificans DSM 6059]